VGREPKSKSIVVLVAQVCPLGIHDVPDLDVGPQAPRRENIVEGQGAAAVLVGRAGDIAQTVAVVVLPDAPLMVDEAVMHEEDRVTRRRSNVRHSAATGADTVVAVGMRAREQIWLASVTAATTHKISVPTITHPYSTQVSKSRYRKADRQVLT